MEKDMESNMIENQQLKKKKKHPVLDCPVIGPLLIFLYAEFVVLILGTILYMFIPEPAFYLAACLLAILMIVIHRLWFRREYRGGLYMESLRDKRFWCIFLTLVAIDAAVCIYDIATTPFIGITVAGVTSSLMAGILEEVENRYMLISVMMRRYKDRGNYMIVLLSTAIIFGLSHYINMDTAADFWPITLQVLITMASGFVMGAVFLRTGNIAVPMAWHCFHDLLCSMHEEAVAANPVIEGVSGADLIECGLMLLAYLVFGILLLKGQKENIRKVWKNRWSDAETQ